jgi:hypothetical protein
MKVEYRQRINTTVYRYLSCIGSTVKQCCGSESEIIRIFWLDPNPNPKKRFGFGYGLGIGFRHCCRMKIFVKKSKNKHLKEKNLMFFY